MLDGRLDTARTEMEQAVGLAAYDDFYRIRLAGFYMASAQPDAAVAQLREALELRPGNRIYLALLAAVLDHLGQGRAADQCRRWAGTLNEYEEDYLRRRQAEWEPAAQSN